MNKTLLKPQKKIITNKFCYSYKVIIQLVLIFFFVFLPSDEIIDTCVVFKSDTLKYII